MSWRGKRLRYLLNGGQISGVGETYFILPRKSLPHMCVVCSDHLHHFSSGSYRAWNKNYKLQKIPVNYPLLAVGINTKTLAFIAGVMHAF